MHCKYEQGPTLRPPGLNEGHQGRWGLNDDGHQGRWAGPWGSTSSLHRWTGPFVCACGVTNTLCPFLSRPVGRPSGAVYDAAASQLVGAAGHLVVRAELSRRVSKSRTQRGVHGNRAQRGCPKAELSRGCPRAKLGRRCPTRALPSARAELRGSCPSAELRRGCPRAELRNAAGWWQGEHRGEGLGLSSGAG